MRDSLELSYRVDDWEFFVNGSINRNDLVIEGTTTNTLVYDGNETVVGSSQNKAFPTTAGTIKGGFNYSHGSQSFGAYYRYNPECGSVNNSGSEWLDNNPALRRDIDKHIRAHSHLASLYYENRFADKYLLHFDGDFRRSNADNDVATTYPESANSDVNSIDERNSTLWAGKLYLKFPLWNGEFTVGKTFLNKSLTVKLSAIDIFDTVNNDWTMNTYGVFVDKRQSYVSSVALSIIYNFQPRKSKYKGSSAAEAEMKRL